MVLEVQGYIEEGEEIGLSEDEVHRLLGAERRRLALDVLAAGGPWELEELAVELLIREGREPADEHAVQQAMITLYHCHLPLMDDLGAIEFDRRSMRVEGCRMNRR